MKADRVTELYGKLTNEERAKLAVRYMADCNDTELDRIISSAPVVEVLATAPAFRRAVDASFDAAAFYAVEYWRCRCHASEASEALSKCAAQRQRGEALQLNAARRHWESRLAALHRVLGWLGREHDHVAELVRRMTAGDGQWCVANDQEPDAEYEVATIDLLSNIIKRDDRRARHPTQQ
jgi:hypothetical protein